MEPAIETVLVCFEVAPGDVPRLQERMLQLGYLNAIMNGNDTVGLPQSVLIKDNISTDVALNDLTMACISSRIVLKKAIAVLTKDGKTESSKEKSSPTSTTSSSYEKWHDQSNSNRPYLRSIYQREFNNSYSGEYDDVEGWNCDACGGNNETGCLYHDPTECRM